MRKKEPLFKLFHPLFEDITVTAQSGVIQDPQLAWATEDLSRSEIEDAFEDGSHTFTRLSVFPIKTRNTPFPISVLSPTVRTAPRASAPILAFPDPSEHAPARSLTERARRARSVEPRNHLARYPAKFRTLKRSAWPVLTAGQRSLRQIE